MSHASSTLRRFDVPGTIRNAKNEPPRWIERWIGLEELKAKKKERDDTRRWGRAIL
jgi:hypothetical protein